MARISAEQVPAVYPQTESKNSVSRQALASVSDTQCALPGHIYVREGVIFPAVVKPATKPKATRGKRGRGRTGKSKRGRPRKLKRGGWRETRYIDHALRKETRRKATLLLVAGFGFTIFATARGLLGRPDYEAKRHICREFSRLGEMLSEEGYSYIGLVAYEKKNGLLHGHLLLHVLPEQMDVVRAWADRFDETTLKPCKIVEGVSRHARPFAGLSDILYVLKQHKPCGKYEEKLKFYEKGEPFVGARISFTKAAKAIIRQAETEAAALAERFAVKAKPPRLRVVVSNPLVPGPEQLSLFPLVARPVSRLSNYTSGLMPAAVAREVETRRRWRGLTQEALARRIGVSRPQFCNAVNGTFGLSEWAAARLREFLLSMPTQKAA